MADALSRKDEGVEALLCVISIKQHDCIVEAKEEGKNESSMWTFIQQLQMDPNV